MARTPLTFQDAFNACCLANGFTQAQVDANATLKAELLHYFNRTYRRGYDYPGTGWEDARTGTTITPEDEDGEARRIDYETLGDAHEFDVWSDDPRGIEGSERLSFTTDSAGILLREEAEEVWITWIPKTVKFTTTAWASTTVYAVGDIVLQSSRNYRCMVAHTGGTFATDLAASKWVLVPFLEILEEFTIAHMQATWLKERGGQAQAGFELQRAALEELELTAVKEAQRNARPGILQSFVSTVSAAVSAALRFLRFDAGQSLTDAQKEQALTNLGILPDAAGKVTYPDGRYFYVNA